MKLRYGLLGVGFWALAMLMPQAAAAAAKKPTISAGGDYSLGIQANGTLWAWGDYWLGLGEPTMPLSPVKVKRFNARRAVVIPLD